MSFSSIICAAVQHLQAVKSSQQCETEDQVLLTTPWELLVNKTLGKAGRTGAYLPLQQCLLYGEGSPWLLRLLFWVSLWELELACMSLHGGKEE